MTSVGDELSAVREENLQLHRKIADLKSRLVVLEKQITFLSQHKTLAAGMSGERLISSLTGGSLTAHTASSDIKLHDGRFIEVKQSKLTNPNPKTGSIARRWQWQKVFGETNEKSYNYLLLVGEADPNHRAAYLDPDSPYVLFSVPHSEVSALCTAGTRGARGILLSSNPSKARGASAELYTRFQVTTAQIAHQFGSLTVDLT